MPACSSFKHNVPTAEQLSKDEEGTNLIPEKANDLKPDVLKSGVENISCSTETLPSATTEETSDAIIHESDRENEACDVSVVDDEGLGNKRKTRVVTGMFNLSENTCKVGSILCTVISLPPIHQNQWHNTSVSTITSA